MPEPTVALIDGHSWRAPLSKDHHGTPYPDRPCDFMNCRRPRTEHARAALGRRWR